MNEPDPASFETTSAANGMPEDVAARLHARLSEAASHRDEAHLVTAARQLAARQRPGVRTLLRQPLTWLVALLSASAAVAITLIFVTVAADSRSSELATPGAELPAAFTEADPPAPSEVRVELDPNGRLRRVVPVDGGDGDHLLFRGERLIRLEPHRSGLVDGVVLELDGAGGIIALRTFERGTERGPWVELDGKGRVTASGTR